MKIRSKEVIELFVDGLLYTPIDEAERLIYKLFPGEEERAVMLEELYRQLSLRRAGDGAPRGKLGCVVTPPHPQLKLEIKNGVWRVVHKGRLYEFAESYDAWLFIYVIKTISGKRAVTRHRSSLYPVNTLIPRVMRPKAVHITLGGVVSFEQEY